MALVSYELALAHLNLTTTDESPDPRALDIETKLAQATAMVIRYIGRPTVTDEWDEDTDPAEDPEFAIAQAAILEVLANLWRFRGDDEDAADREDGPITPKVIRMLSQIRDPTFS